MFTHDDVFMLRATPNTHFNDLNGYFKLAHSLAKRIEMLLPRAERCHRECGCLYPSWGKWKRMKAEIP